MEASYLLAGASFIIGGGLGVVGMGAFCSGRFHELNELHGEALDLVAQWRREWVVAASKAMELRAAIDKREAPLREANARRHAEAKAREEAEAQRSAALHDQMMSEIAATRLGEVA